MFWTIQPCIVIFSFVKNCYQREKKSVSYKPSSRAWFLCLVSLHRWHMALLTAMCKPGEVYCGSGQCRPHGSQCNLQACGDSSEETNCGNIALFHLKALPEHKLVCALSLLIVFLYVCIHVSAQSLFPSQQVNVTTCARTKYACPSLLCVTES